MIEACLLDSERIELVNDVAGRLAKTKFIKCDVYSDELVFRAPEQTGKRDRITLANCYFRGSPKAASIIQNRVDAPAHISVAIKSLLKTPKKLSGTHRKR